jgi:F0F1-type ATP synthase assembly protein I
LKENKVLKELSPYLTIGVEFAFSILLFVWLGIWLDEKFNTSPIFTLGLILFSVIGGFVRMFFKISFLGKQSDRNNTRNNSTID